VVLEAVVPWLPILPTQSTNPKLLDQSDPPTTPQQTHGGGVTGRHGDPIDLLQRRCTVATWRGGAGFPSTFRSGGAWWRCDGPDAAQVIHVFVYSYHITDWGTTPTTTVQQREPL